MKNDPIGATAEGMPTVLRRLIADAEGDMRKVRDLALIVHDQMDGASGVSPQMQGALSWLTSELVVIGERLNERFDAMFDAATGSDA